VRARGLADRHNVAANPVVHINLVGHGADLHHGLRLRDRFHAQFFQLGGEHLEFLLGIRIVHSDHHGEAVQLRFRQTKDAFLFDRVLSSQHPEGIVHAVGVLADGDLALLHHLEQRTLHLGGCAIDFVGEQQVGEHRPQHG